MVSGTAQGAAPAGFAQLSLSSSPPATSTEFAPMPLVLGQGVRSLLGAGFLGVNRIPVPSKIRFPHRYFCSKTKLGERGI